MESDKMNMKRAGVAATLVMMLAIATAASAEQQSEDVLVRQTVETYLHGLKFNDVPSFKKAFYPEAKLFFVKKDGTLGQLTQEQWYQGFAESAGKQEEGELSIVATDITGKAASVKVREVYPTSVYTDYVSLLKLGAEWKIVSKVYMAEKR
jgi:Putative lumazine-binding